MLGSICFSLVVKSLQASARLCGNSVSQNRKRLSGRFRTKMMVSSASRGGGRSLSLNSVSLVVNCGWLRILSFSGREKREKITMVGSCLGEKKLEQVTSILAEIQFAKMLHLSMICPEVLLGSSSAIRICRR